MSSTTLIRLGGLALCLGGLAATLFVLLAAPEGGFLAAFVGTALYLVTGVLTAFVMPLLASVAPSALEVGGALLASLPLLLIFLGSGLLMLVGYTMLAVDALRAGMLPRPASWAVLVGA